MDYSIQFVAIDPAVLLAVVAAIVVLILVSVYAFRRRSSDR